MTVRRVLLFLAVVALLAPVAPAAAAIEVHAGLDRTTARVGDQVVLTLEVTGGLQSLPEPKLTDLSADFEVYSGGSSRNFSIVNGAMSSSIALRYVLVPRHEGTFTIPPIVVDTKREQIRTEPLTLTVTRGTPPPSPPPVAPGERGATSGQEEIFVRASVDKATVTLYEQVTCRVRLYSAIALIDIPSFTPPTTQGFLREELPRSDPRVEVIKGRQYQVIEWAVALFPTAPGKLTIGESALECEVRAASRDPFSFFGFDAKRLSLRSPPVSVDVKPLPPGAPAGFGGMVGDFRLKATLDKDQVAQNDPVTLTLEVTGQGSLRTVGDIEPPALPEFRAYPSKSEDVPSVQGGIMGGTVRRQFVLVPLATGEKTIPSIRLVTYSTRRGEYQTLETAPLVLHVLPPAGNPSGFVPAPGSRDRIEVVGRDIRFIETGTPQFAEIGSAGRRARGWLLFLLVPGLTYAGAWWWERRREKRGENRVLMRRLRAGKEARRLLKSARAVPEAERAARAAEALRVYLADRYDLPRAGLTREDAERVLRADTKDPDPVLGFLETTDAARFAPVRTGSGGNDWVEECARWIERLETNR